jgi:hypothetical protein
VGRRNAKTRSLQSGRQRQWQRRQQPWRAPPRWRELGGRRWRRRALSWRRACASWQTRCWRRARAAWRCSGRQQTCTLLQRSWAQMQPPQHWCEPSARTWLRQPPWRGVPRWRWRWAASGERWAGSACRRCCQWPLRRWWPWPAPLTSLSGGRVAAGEGRLGCMCATGAGCTIN